MRRNWNKFSCACKYWFSCDCGKTILCDHHKNENRECCKEDCPEWKD